ncbi:MAG: TlpA disulfide reductase family protein [Parvibaculum sp.]|uniref:TlpA family protein disulfide reductase n=1 Tax=Parvibaculum sp. TaxID=2024848 RepID=UPI0032EB1B5D
MVQVGPKSIAILAGAALLIVGAVYLIVQGGGNPDDPGAPAAPPALQALAVGDMANFRAAAEPSPVPAVVFEGGAGEALTFDDFEGRVVLLNLWATWCAPCREEMPALDRLQAALGSERFEVVALSVDSKGHDLAHRFFDENGIGSLAFYIDPTARANVTLKAFGLPTTLLIAPDGREIGRLVGPAEWDGDDAKRLIEAVLTLYAPSANN